MPCALEEQMLTGRYQERAYADVRLVLSAVYKQ
jgi:hypothetical protein